jgi:hypothetical protein
VSGSPLGSASQVNSAPGSLRPFFAANRDMGGFRMRVLICKTVLYVPYSLKKLPPARKKTNNGYC